MDSYLAQFFGLWVVAVAALFTHRRLAAARSHLKAALVFDDFVIAGLLSGAVVSALLLIPGAGVAIALVMSAVALVWWLDGVMFCATGFNVTLENALVALQGWKTISADAPLFLGVLRRRLWSVGAPLAFSALLFVLAGDAGRSSLDAVLLAVAVVAILVGVGKIRVSAPTAVGLLLATALFFFLVRSLRFLDHEVAWLSGAVLVLSLLAAARGQGQRFWRRKSPLRSFLGRKGLQVPAEQFVDDRNIFAESAPSPLTPSARFGELRHQNVILFALESFSAWAMEAAARDGSVQLPFLGSLHSRGRFSTLHHAISPNTNQAFEYLYRGGYPAEASYPYVQALRAAGYHTALLTTQDLNDFRRFEIVDRIGFDEVRDRKDKEFVPQRHDYNLLDRVEWIAERLSRGPTFLHLMNNQPHSPYVVVDGARFGAGSNDRRQQYLAALAETDYILGRLFEELGQRIDLDNVLLVLVGDHGQSFGELGYDMHSSSTIKEQVRVPLWIVHPRMAGEGRLQSRTCHLDLMPTILDLVGVGTSVPVRGQSLFAAGREQDYFLHSEVKVRGIPAQMSFLSGRQKWMTDIINGVSYLMDDEDAIERVLSDPEERHLHAVMGSALQRRGMWPGESR